MPHVRIYQPARSAMQSGKGKTKQWLLVFLADNPYFIDDLMGWTGQRDTTRQLRLSFPTREAAVEYAKSKNLSYEIIEPKASKHVAKTYADNFKAGRVSG